MNSIPRPRWNSNEADWTNYVKELEKTMRWILPTCDNYKKLVGFLRKLRGAAPISNCRKLPIPTKTMASHSVRTCKAPRATNYRTAETN